MENVNELEALKSNLLKEYKALEEDLSYAQDDFEESMIVEKREKLAKKIKDLAAKIKNIKLGDENEKI